MREKWDKQKTEPRISDGQPIPQRLIILSEPMYKPKLLLKSPSMRAIKNYNNLSIIDNSNNPSIYDNLTFIPESDQVDFNNYDELYTNTKVPTDLINNGIDHNLHHYNHHIHNHHQIQKNGSTDLYDYTTIGSASVKTTTSATGSELDSEKNEMGSTIKLVHNKMGMSCQTWFSHLETILCTTSLAASFGNLYRLPQKALVLTDSGLPFLIAYIILTIVIGLPLLFLELGIGQLAQEGFIKSWRAVPFFKGIGYVKLIAGCLLSIYYPLYLGLSLYYIIWLSKSSLPFSGCAVVKIKMSGYSADGYNGQQCLRKTFLESPFVDPRWYGIFACLLFLIWVVISVLSIHRKKSFLKSLAILLFPTLGCFIALIVKSIFIEMNFNNLNKLNIDWMKFFNAEIWYYAAIQVFFSTHVGFGTFVTNASVIYNKFNPLWTALGYIGINILFGIFSIIICYILIGHTDNIIDTDNIKELHLISLIYTALLKSKNNFTWAIVGYSLILIAGIINMIAIMYSLLKTITVYNRKKFKWWQSTLILSFIGFLFGCGLLLKSNFQLVHLLDHYIVGNLILVSVILEVFALIAFYGTERIKSDFEFMLGHILSKFWLILWWIIPILLTTIFAWALTTLPLENNDPDWLYGTGWAVVLTATIFIFVIGFYTIFQQEDGYTFIDKFRASLKPSHNWGPKDPILRHNWVQWNTKAKAGERDFTLKRKGTRDYTRSIKREIKKSQAATINGVGGDDGVINKNDQNQNKINSSVYYNHNNSSLRNDLKKPLRVTSLIDSMDSIPTYLNVRNTFDTNGFKTNLNPLARTNQYGVDIQDGSSEGYGTFRKGPYVIPEGNLRHVCHRRYSQSEAATEF